MATKLPNGRGRAKVTSRGEVVFSGTYSTKGNAQRAEDNFRANYEQETGNKIVRGRQPGATVTVPALPLTLADLEAEIERLYIVARAIHVAEITEIDRKIAAIRS